MVLPLATDVWSTVSSLATGVGTLVLAVATFASVRSSQRSARVAEEALLEQRRPVLGPSRFDDPAQKIMFVERNWVHAGGGRGAAEHTNGRIYLVMSLRNVGSGIGVCQAWAATAQATSARQPHLPESEFRAQTRDLYIPAGDLGLWQGALRDPDEPGYADVGNAIDALEPLTIDLLYSDQVGEQRTITRFALAPYTNPDDGEVNWTVSVLRHWFLDRAGPRSERDIEARTEQIMARVQADGQDAGPVEDVAPVAVEAADGSQADEADVSETAEAGQAEDGSIVQPNGGEPVTVIPRPNCE